MQFLEEQEFLVRRMKSSKLGGWCHMSKGCCPGVWVILVLMWWINAAMDFSYWPHVDMVR